MRSPQSMVILAFAFLVASYAWGESASVGRGGPYVQYHASSISVFDSELQGQPMVIGGVGFASITKNFRLGGGGGGGFLWNGSDNATFGLGFGGMLGEYSITNWLAARMMIGGGGFAIAKIVSDTISERTISRIDAEGFILFYPAIHFDFPIHNWLKFSAHIGYFLPNNSKLHSVTVGVGLLFGKI